jgi:hypothetical protein
MFNTSFLSQQLTIKRQEKEFLSEFEELTQQFKEILTTAGINQSQFPVTPNRNLHCYHQMLVYHRVK